MNKPMLFTYTLNENSSNPYHTMLVYCKNAKDGEHKLRKEIGYRKDDLGQKHGVLDCWGDTIL